MEQLASDGAAFVGTTRRIGRISELRDVCHLTLQHFQIEIQSSLTFSKSGDSQTSLLLKFKLSASVDSG
jgi:hypothetical protein